MEWYGADQRVSTKASPGAPLIYLSMCDFKFFSPLWWAFFPTNELVKYSYTSTHHISYILSHMRIDTSICFMQVYRGRQKSDQNKKVIQFEPVIIALDYTTQLMWDGRVSAVKATLSTCLRAQGSSHQTKFAGIFLLGSSKRCWDSGWHFCFQW